MRRPEPTQVERVHRLLQKRGRYGLTQVDLLLPNVADGGKPITRLAARIKDLREQGVPIETAGIRDSTQIYRLSVVNVDRSGPPLAAAVDAGDGTPDVPTPNSAPVAIDPHPGRQVALFDPPSSPAGAYDEAA